MTTSIINNEFDASVFLKRGREHSLKKRHHWIFSGAIEKTEGNPVEGQLLTIKDHKGRELGYGFYGTKSIAVRVLSFDPKIKAETQIFYLLKLARKKRKKLGLIPSDSTDSFRLFNSEGDLLPGLTIDKLNDIIIIQTHHVGLTPYLEQIKDYLLQKFPATKSIVVKTGTSKESKDNLNFIFGSEPNTIINENNIKFTVNVLEGQKTGFFLDQRVNREILASYAKGKNILNLFCYTGGFSIYALKHSAKKVVSVDSSKIAIQAAETNEKFLVENTGESVFIEEDCIKYLRENDEKFDIVICDPPALVKSNRDIHKGLRHYFELQKLALAKVNSGGLFFTFSCSQFVLEKDLEKTVLKAGAELGLKLNKIQSLKQAPCHTINLDHPESLYLKGFVFEVSS